MNEWIEFASMWTAVVSLVLIITLLNIVAYRVHRQEKTCKHRDLRYWDNRHSQCQKCYKIMPIP